MGSRIIGILGETKSQQYSEHLYFQHKMIRLPLGIKRGLHFITNQVLFVHNMHIKLSLHHLIKLVDYFIIEYQNFSIFDRRAPTFTKFKA